MEDIILSLAKFVMGFQRAFVERRYGSDFKITWDANLLHHVVGPISNAVYGAHSDYSALLCSRNKKQLTQVQLLSQDDMQVLTIYCSNYNENQNECTNITYTYNDKKIGSAKLGLRGIHIQCLGSQTMGVKHEVHVEADACRSGIY
jgi:hypothetical protein